MEQDCNSTTHRSVERNRTVRTAKRLNKASCAVSSRDFAAIENLPDLKQYMDAFRKATGLPFLKLVPPNHHQPYVQSEKESEVNPLCYLVRNSQTGCQDCLENQRSLLQSTGGDGEIRHVNCSVGLTEFAIPVMEGKRHVATLVSGQIFVQQPTERDFERVAKRLSTGKEKRWLAKARKAFFATPVISTDRIEAIIRLLNDFAEHIPEDARRHEMTSAPTEHQAVRSAKQFIETSAGDSVTFEQVLHHVHVSRFHFCKIFKKSTGLTLTEYMTKFRLTKAKTLLLDSSLRISEVVFAAGFGSVSQFNSVFRRLEGMSPTEYREMKCGKIRC